MKLSRNNLNNLPAGVTVPGKEMFSLPEKVLHFGTGILSRGIPAYFIDKANQQGIFNGRIVMVSNTPYDIDATDFEQQDFLFTQISRGVENGRMVEEKFINASISRVLHAKQQWRDVLMCAANAHLKVIIADSSEVDLSPDTHDTISAMPPASFAGMLLAFLYERYKQFNGDTTKGMVIIPAELIPQNGPRLEAIILELAHINEMESGFMDWLETANQFCPSLMDRVIPNHAFPYNKKFDGALPYEDNLQVVSESFCGWFIESSDAAVKEALSFSKANEGVVIADDIEVFRELKLRLLNGVHTYTCGLSFLAGLETVCDAMTDDVMSSYIQQLMVEEIAPAIPYYIPKEEIDRFAMQVLDRFRNPYIRHTWLSICLHYSQKMRLRNLPVLVQHYQQTSAVPERMALGFAAHILFMNCRAEGGKYFGYNNGRRYQVPDERAAFYANAWKGNNVADVVHEVLGDAPFWGMDLTALPGFEAAVTHFVAALKQGNILQVVQQTQQLNQEV